MALAWDSHVHHHAIRAWFAERADRGWATCPITESGFVRVSANPKLLRTPIGVSAAQQVLGQMRGIGAHRLLANDVSITADDLPRLAGHRQVTDAVLVTLARRHGTRLITFDSSLVELAPSDTVELLVA